MNKYFIPLFVFLSLSFIFPPLINAAPLPAPTPTPIAVLPDFQANRQVTIVSPVNRDLFTAGRQVDIDSDVNGSVFAAGGQITLRGNVSQDIIAAGGIVTIDGVVAKNVVLAGGQVNLGPHGQVNGYFLAAGNQVTLDGKVLGPVKTASRQLAVSNTASIGGDLEADANLVNLSSQASISGQKRIIKHTDSRPLIPGRDSYSAVRGFVANPAFRLAKFIGELILLLVLVRFVIGSFDFYKGSAVMSYLGWGLVVLIVSPFVILALLVSLIGLPLGIILALLYGLSLYLAHIFTAFYLGNWFSARGWLSAQSISLKAALGLLLIFILTSIPVVGHLVGFLSLLVGLGIIFQLRTRFPAGQKHS